MAWLQNTPFFHQNTRHALAEVCPGLFAGLQFHLDYVRQVGVEQDVFLLQSLDNIFNHPNHFIIGEMEIMPGCRIGMLFEEKRPQLRRIWLYQLRTVDRVVFDAHYPVVVISNNVWHVSAILGIPDISIATVKRSARFIF